MSRRLLLIATPAALALAALSAPASASPSRSDIAQARAACHANKMHVQSLRNRLGAESPDVTPAVREWEHSCARAQSLIDMRDGKPVLRAEGGRTSEFARYETGKTARQGCD
ncbi:MAG TPA: hypothetical protein VM074_10600 [Solimonas sp.]|nr:hypothetical protein [Solimonas sp.]